MHSERNESIKERLSFIKRSVVWYKLRQYAFAIREMTGREIKRKYARSVLGIIWSVLNPLLSMVVITMVFSTMFRRSIQNFPIYYLTGQIFWTLFQTSTTASMTALVDNRSLLLQAKLPKQVFMLSRIYTALVNFAYTCIAYVLMLLVFQVPLNPVMPLFFVAVILMVLFSMGIGYALATAYVFFADIRYLYGVFLTFLMYLSAIFYPVDALPEAMQRVIGVNPVYVMIAFARKSILEGTVPEPIEWVKALAWSIGSLVVGLLIFKTNENKVMQKL